MAQPSVAEYFNTRKRPAIEPINRPNKILLLNHNEILESKVKTLADNTKFLTRTLPEEMNNAKNDTNLSKQTDLFKIQRKKVTTRLTFENTDTMVSPNISKKSSSRTLRQRKSSTDSKQQGIEKLLENMRNKQSSLSTITETTQDILAENSIKDYPTTPTKNKSKLEEIHSSKDEMSLADIKSRLSRSSRLAELKASMAKINSTAVKLEELEKRKTAIQSSLKTFKKIELEIVSPKKLPSSPQKAYLSPVKSLTSSPVKKLSALSSPVKSSLTSPNKLAAYERFSSLAYSEKPALTLPYKYRCLAEIFRSLDSVCAMFFNRGETITFKKIRPAIQELLRKNFTESHLEQINFIYPDAYSYSQEKIRNFGSTSKHEKYELVLVPNLPQLTNEVDSKTQERMNSAVLLERRRKLFDILIEKVKDYHQEFLENLEQPMNIPREKLTRWHPEFDVDKVPDIEHAPLPQPPNIEKVSTAKDVLSRARNLFSCNTRMEKALEKLSNLQDAQNTPKVDIKIESTENSLMKGIPKSLLEKVRARQAAKALETMTRAPEKDKESQMYAQLPDLAKYTRNIFVSEKKSVLPLENVINKLNNSFRTNFTPSELEKLLRLLSNMLPEWIVFHEVRKAAFIKLSKDMDMIKLLHKLDKLISDKANI